jgi:hypothetical protein
MVARCRPSLLVILRILNLELVDMYLANVRPR